jgi:hypothetical protein
VAVRVRRVEVGLGTEWLVEAVMLWLSWSSLDLECCVVAVKASYGVLWNGTVRLGISRQSRSGIAGLVAVG